MDKTILQSYIPLESVDEICDTFALYPIKIRVVKPRKRVQGSYRRPKPSAEYHLITINSDLNRYTFLITLLHEIAHLQAWENNKTLTHGKDWRLCFIALIKQYLSLDVFPQDVHYALEKHLENIKSSDFQDIFLSKTLQKYDAKPSTILDLILLEDVPENAVFLYAGKKMEKQSLLRKYYLCRDLKTNKLYRCHPLMKVSVLPK
ncbi:MAG: SprT-like domain-containing protein [Bacteroidales bacterium]|jgi:hypothetical protein|nr:SprT-like domain-containing protein [Bacteroidales bacterium]